MSALKDFATVAELAGPNCYWSTNFRWELDWVREHWRECRDYPSLADCQRLPSHADCCRNARFVWKHLDYLERAKRERLHWDLEDRICHVKRLLNFWQLASDATEERDYWCRRRKALDDIRRLVGSDAYAAGAWPVVVLQ